MTTRIALLACILAAAPLSGRQQATFRASVDAVSVPVSVTNRNRPVGGLSAADFELLDNGVKQEIALTAVDAMPTDVTLLVDTSGSISGKALDRIKIDAQAMADLLQPNDRVRLISFARDAVDVFGFLPGGATLDFTRMSAGGTSSFYDALVAVLASTPPSDRPHLVFAVTDGRDNSSFTGAAHVVEVAKTSGAVLCVVLVQSSNPLVREGGAVDAIDPMTSEQSVVNLPNLPGSNIVAGATNVPGATSKPVTAISRNAGPYTGGPNRSALGAAADATGGVVTSDSSRTPIPQLFRRVLDDFRASYVLTYRPTGVDGAGTHTITVRTGNRNHVIRARKSYER